MFSISENIQIKIILFLITKKECKIDSVLAHLKSKNLIPFLSRIYCKAVRKLIDKKVLFYKKERIWLSNDNNDVALFRDMVFVYYHKENLLRLANRFNLNDYLVNIFMRNIHMNDNFKYYREKYYVSKEKVEKYNKMGFNGY